MSPAPRARHEPEENEFLEGREHPSVERGQALYAGLLKGLLDQIDDTMRRAIEHGLEPELRAIVAKHLPALAAPTTPALGPITADGDRALHLAWGVAKLSEHGRRLAAANEIGHASVATCVGALLAALREPGECR